jgi:serine/threonine protein kinase
MNAPPNREVALFSAALELPAAQRAAYLDDACGDDPALRLRVEALLRVHDEALPFLENPLAGAQQSPLAAGASAATMHLSPPLAEKAGDRIGRYKLLQQLGEGGCGVVYMAEQSEPVRRRVALKVIKLGMDTRQVIARFEAERQALALMDHPNIAKVLDAGSTETGRPFFVMELVRGIKITDYSDQNHLSTQERLKLFMQVCQAIQHAHQKGIIHRDIKPSNILVTVSEPGAPGCPKVIDFGIAKATTGQQLTDKTVFTAFEQFIGTPAYMSPEQATMTALEVDTRTDIYALGVLLYELLTGKTPLDQKELLASGLDEMRRTIREKEPIRPSTRLGTMLEGDLTTTAKHRHTDAPKLIHLLRGDLDWIVMKALEKDRARRYETANGLSRDVERYLADEPVVARPPSKLYRLQKLARRNKLAFAATGAVSAALVIGLAASTWEYFKERKARQRAVAAEKQAVTISRFLTDDLLFQATPEQNAREKQVTMEEVLQVATSNLDQNAEIAQQPLSEATLRLAVGRTWLKLGFLDEAGRNLTRAFDLRRRELGLTDLETLAAQHALAEFFIYGVGERKDGLRLAYETWQGRQRLLGETNRDTLNSEELYADGLLDAGNFKDSGTIYERVLEIRERVLGPYDKDTICALADVGGMMEYRGTWADAEHHLQEALTRFQRIGKADDRVALICLKELAMCHLLQGDPASADKLLAEAASRATRILGTNSLYTLQFQRARARALAEEGRLEEAEALAKATLAARRRQTSDFSGTGRTLLYLGGILVQEGKLGEAEPYLQEALKIFGEHLPMKPELAPQAANWLGAIQVARKDYPQAQTLLLSGPEQFFIPATEMSPNERRIAVGHIVKLYEAWGKPDQTAVWQKKLDQFPKKLETR